MPAFVAAIFAMYETLVRNSPALWVPLPRMLNE